jgi:hypothetical protein
LTQTTFVPRGQDGPHRHSIDGGRHRRNADPVTRPEAATDDDIVAFGAQNLDDLEAQPILGIHQVDEIAARIRAQGRTRQYENVLDTPALNFGFDEEADGQGCRTDCSTPALGILDARD